MIFIGFLLDDDDEDDHHDQDLNNAKNSRRNVLPVTAYKKKYCSTMNIPRVITNARDWDTRPACSIVCSVTMGVDVTKKVSEMTSSIMVRRRLADEVLDVCADRFDVDEIIV
ncbi:hypothetical protein BpHYR1_042193 [Brachionus plicatilis]|uniref:Uncharacterized protein n=1 Tax=Brachionus plicatilis TaxID=10195 RepID=A0A3M7SH52_BRAPC|nr:hypothetical protein BpHYR1_042193 [Brachionus plicatilis]